MARRYVDQGLAVLQGYKMGAQFARDWQDDKMRGDIAAVEGDRSTPVASGEEAAAAGQTAYQQALAAAPTDEDKARVTTDYQPTLDALQANKSSPAGTVHSLGIGSAFRQQPAPFSAGEVEGSMSRERAAIYQRGGHEDEASRALLNTARSRDLSDQDAIRAAYVDPAATAAPGAPMVSTNRAATGLSAAEDASALPAGVQAQLQPGADRVARAAKPAADSVDLQSHYLERIAPRVQAEYLRQGKLTEAKAYQDLMDSQEGKSYTKNWTNAVRKIEMGDLDGAVPDLAKLYTSYPDGQRAQATKLDGGKYQIDMIDEATGKTVNTVTLESGDLVRKAAMALRPEKLAEFLATQEGKRTAEAASLNKSLELERLKQEGQDSRDDRRDERLTTRIDADAERRAGGTPLTPTQQRSNAEIDAAREAVAGMSPQDIMRKTAKATNTGRENPDYDPGLARQAGLANRRKIGADDAFDGRQTKPAAPAFDRTDIAKRFRADPSMGTRTLGKETQNGIEVMEKGKLIGYFK